MRLRGWLRIRAAVRSSTPMDIPFPVEVRSSPALLEPGVVGFFRPILLCPAGIVERLTPSQLQAVLAHELCHIQRRDNLTAAIHMMVEAVFWFHPLVWWISARLMEERERACDEEVLELGSEPQVYAESILKTCEFCVESPLACVSGVTGADLKKRIVRIMTAASQRTSSVSGRRLLLAVDRHSSHRRTGGVRSGERPANPCAIGATDRRRPCRPSRLHQSSRIVPGVDGCFLDMPPVGSLATDMTAQDDSLHGRMLAFSSVTDYQLSGGPSWIDSERYDIDAKVDGLARRRIAETTSRPAHGANSD